MDSLILRDHFNTIPSLGNLDHYINSVRKIPCLTQEEELSLAKDFAENGNQEAAGKLVLSHLKVVLSVARKYLGYGLPREDLIQEGNIGLMKAVKNFNYKLGVRLVSYAIHWIRAEIGEFVIKNYRIVKSFTTKADRKLFFNFRSMREDLGRQISQTEAEEMAKELGVTLKDVMKSAEIFNNPTLSLDYDGPVDQSESDAFKRDFIPDTRWEPSFMLENKQKIERDQNLIGMLKNLKDRERYILEQRWLTENPKTLHELGEELGITYERVRQIEKASLIKLKERTQNELL